MSKNDQVDNRVYEARNQSTTKRDLDNIFSCSRYFGKKKWVSAKAIHAFLGASFLGRKETRVVWGFESA